MDWRRRANWYALIAVVLILGVGWNVLSHVRPDAPGSSTGGSPTLPRRGARAPDFTLTDLEGLRGQAVLPNFWAT